MHGKTGDPKTGGQALGHCVLGPKDTQAVLAGVRQAQPDSTADWPAGL
jgi:hypothetical protein